MQEVATEEVADAHAGAPRPRSRATLILAVLALALSVAGWTSLGRDAFEIDRRAFWGQPWRFFAAPLAHAHVLQLAATLAGLWVFGRAAEARLGSGRMLGVCGLFALAIGFAEQALDHGGDGLLGVVCGLWALLLVGGTRHARLAGATPLGLNLLMLALLGASPFVFPALSRYGLAAGALCGALAGLCLEPDGVFKRRLVPGAVLALLVLGAGATRWRASWNRGGAAVEYDRAAFDALERGDEPLAEKELRTALVFDPRYGLAWWNLSAVLAKLGRTEEAAEACWSGFECSRYDAEQAAKLLELELWALNAHLEQKEASKAFPFAQRVAKLLPDDLEVWERVRELAHELENPDWYERADRECARLAPVEQPSTK